MGSEYSKLNTKDSLNFDIKYPEDIIIHLTDDVYLTVGKYYNDGPKMRFYYFAESSICEVYGIDVEKGFTTVEKAKEYATKKVVAYFKRNLKQLKEAKLC